MQTHRMYSFFFHSNGNGTRVAVSVQNIHSNSLYICISGCKSKRRASERGGTNGNFAIAVAIVFLWLNVRWIYGYDSICCSSFILVFHRGWLFNGIYIEMRKKQRKNVNIAWNFRVHFFCVKWLFYSMIIIDCFDSAKMLIDCELFRIVSRDTKIANVACLRKEMKKEKQFIRQASKQANCKWYTMNVYSWTWYRMCTFEVFNVQFMYYFFAFNWCSTYDIYISRTVI